ncbi:MAG: nucleotide-sugar transporter-domain-containing protein [Piptocephalis tieghemiana]|nr:MAG: nucleotide-sugar transporter-domain-containing protein [Piptocephalis tieghemiana]
MPTDVTTPSLWGVPLKHLSLLTLVLQNSALVLLMRYSRTVPGPAYIPATAVALTEALKLVTSLAIHLRDTYQMYGSLRAQHVWSEVFGGDAWKVGVPAALYVLQNNLGYVAVSNLDAATFQVTYQMKIITTALCSVAMLGARLTGLKWISLILLTAGVALVQLPAEASDKEVGSLGSQMTGLLAVSCACLLSGLAGVYFEKILKGSGTSVWVRNVQLSLFSLPPALLGGVILFHGHEVMEHGFFYGYTIWTWAAILAQALGGMLVAVVVKYADNILKGFATSISILVSCVASIFLFDFSPRITFLIGAALVVYATYLYGRPSGPKPEEKEKVLEEGKHTEEEEEDEDEGNPFRANGKDDHETIPLKKVKD